MLVFGRTTRIYDGDPIVGSHARPVARVSPVAAVVVGVALVLGAIAAVIVGRYVAADPFEYDIKQLRSEGADAREARATGWRSPTRTFGRGISGRTVIAADRLEQVPLIVAALKAVDTGSPAGAADDRRDRVDPRRSSARSASRSSRCSRRSARMLDDDALDSARPTRSARSSLELRPPDDLQRGHAARPARRAARASSPRRTAASAT